MDDEHEKSERSREASRQQNENTLEGLLEGLRSLLDRQQEGLRLSQERVIRNLRRNISRGQGKGSKNVESRGETSGKQDDDDNEDTLETLLDKLHSEQESLLETLRSSQENMLKNLLRKLKKVGGRVNSLNLGEDVDPAINEGTRRNLNGYSPLYKAALKGDWERARAILDEDPGALTARITVSLKTALHVAAGAGHTQFVINLVNIMREEDLEIRDDKGHTALFFAAMAGCDASARAMVSKNQNLTQIRNADNVVPVLFAALYGGKGVLQYLCSQTRDEDPSPFRGEAGGRLLNNIIASGYHDVALFLLKQYPDLATGKDESGTTALDVLAQRPIAFPSGNHLNFVQHLTYSCIKVNPSDRDIDWGYGRGDEEDPSESSANWVPMHIFILFAYMLHGYRCMKDLFFRSTRCVPCIKRVYDTKLMNSQALELLKFICDRLSLMESSQILDYFLEANILRRATENGIVEFIIECIQYFPDLMWMRTQGRSIFHMAVEYRQEKIFNLIYGLSAHKKMLASFRVDLGDNMLHLAAKLAPASRLHSVSGAALQMQRELQWFKAVEKIVDPSCKVLINLTGKTPQALFSEEHSNLVEQGAKWMKDTASSGMVVATLIATVGFAAAFTVPGGNNQDNGVPIFLENRSFVVFIVSDAIGLFSSATSVLMFLSILTARYAEEDFLYSLPKKLIVGVATLFISIAAMVIAFSATLHIVSSHQYAWLIAPIVTLACLTVISFLLSQFRLFVEIYRSTFGSGIFDHKSKHVIY